MQRDSVRWTIALVAILLMAFALRVVGLDRQPLWWDEGNNVYFAHQSPLALARESRIANDTDPPAHRLALGGWRMLVGSSPFAIRFFSALASIVTVALTWVVGCWLADKKTALLAVLLISIAPMQVYYAREAKGYAFASACALLATFAWGRRLGYASASPLRGASTGWWIVYVLSTAAAVGTHYYLGALVVWQGLWVAGSMGMVLAHTGQMRREALARLGRWLLAAGAVALLLMPWALVMFSTTVRGVVGASKWDALALWDYLGQVSSAFGAGPGGRGLVALATSCGLLVLGMIGALAGSKRAFLITWVAVPLVVAYWIQAAYSFFSPRFLLYLGSALYLLVGRGIIALERRFSTVVTVAIVVAIIGAWIPSLAYVPAGPRNKVNAVDEIEDPRPVVARIRALAQPDDALVYGYIWQVGYLLSYYPQNELEFYRAYYTPQTVEAELKSIFASHPRLWLLGYRIAAENAHNLSASWLETEAYKVESNWYGDHHLSLYLAPDFWTRGVGPDTGIATFDKQIELRYPMVDAHLIPGDILALPLRWRALDGITQNYAVFVHLSEPGTPPLAQNDGPPRNGLAPTSTWVIGREVIDRRALMLPDTLPAGRYQVTLGLYGPSDGNRLLVSSANGVNDSDVLLLGYVEVEH